MASKFPKFVERLADSARAAADDLSEKFTDARSSAQKKAQAAQASAMRLIELLANAPEDRDHQTALVERFVRALEGIEGQLDKNADAIAIGFLRGAGVGIAEMAGTEIFYLRPDGPVRGQIRVSALSARIARLSVGASTGAYAACFYGDRELLARSGTRRGGDASLLVASIGLLRIESHREGVSAGGWMVGLGAGVGLGVPILSNLSGIEIIESAQGSFPMDANDARPIEDIVQRAPDRNLRRKVAQVL